MARPKAEIDEGQVEKLAMLQCSASEIANFFGVNQTTISRRFADLLIKGRESGKMSLRRMQWKSANEGSYTMQIWLGKQYLGQRETTDINLRNLPEPIKFVRGKRELSKNPPLFRR